jgi:FkbM family methyltransferase
MKALLSKLYARVMARRSFRKLNQVLVKLGLKGLGLLFSHENPAENGELFFIRKAIADYKIKNLFDVGANQGNYARLFVDLSFAGDIFCFEPHPVTFRKLDAALQGPSIQKFDIGLSAEKGSFNIYDYQSQDGSEHASLFKNVIEEVHKGKAIEHLVKVDTVDDFAASHEVGHIGLLKIDTEGNEFNVLMGARRMLSESRIDLLHLEFNEMNVVSRVFMKDFFKLLPNYNLYRLLPNDFLPLTYDHSLFLELFSYQNIVAIRKDVDKEKN